MVLAKPIEAYNPPIVDPDVAGRAVSFKVLPLLGDNAWIVWVHLLHRRCLRGRTALTNDQIAAGCRHACKDGCKRRHQHNSTLSSKEVRVACSRLKRAGLLDFQGWKFTGNRDARGRRARIARREVLGDFRNGVVFLPPSVQLRIRGLPQWGGCRSGAGRRRSIPKLEVSTMPKNTNSVGILPNQEGGREESRGRGLREDQERIDLRAKALRCTPSGEDASGVRFRPPSEVRSGSDSPPSITGEALASLSPTLKKEAPARAVNEDYIGRRISAAGARKVAALKRKEEADRAARAHAIFPPYPSNKVIGVAAIPNPPLLQDAMTDLERAERLVRAYNGAVESRYPKLGRSYVLCNGDLKRSKFWLMLKNAAREMLDFEIAPAAWASFSMDVWINHNTRGGKTRPPPISFVFAERFIQERHGWFNSESGYSGGRVIMSAIHRDCLDRHGGLVRQLDRAPLMPDSTPEDQIRALVERWFPGGWQRWYDQAKTEAADTRAWLARMVQAGEYVW